MEKLIFAFIFLITLSSCDKTLKIKNTIEKIEKNGDLIKLDRSKTTGGDEDPNGVRHDINVWIGKQSKNEKEIKALTQLAKSFQLIMTSEISLKNTETQEILSKSLNDNESRAIHCIWITFETQRARFFGAKLEQITVNTKERIKIYGQYAKALSGSVITLPNGDTCDP